MRLSLKLLHANRVVEEGDSEAPEALLCLGGLCYGYVRAQRRRGRLLVRVPRFSPAISLHTMSVDEGVSGTLVLEVSASSSSVRAVARYQGSTEAMNVVLMVRGRLAGIDTGYLRVSEGRLVASRTIYLSLTGLGPEDYLSLTPAPPMDLAIGPWKLELVARGYNCYETLEARVEVNLAARSMGVLAQSPTPHHPHVGQRGSRSLHSLSMSLGGRASALALRARKGPWL